MTQSARRLTIFTLTMMIFALLFAGLVTHNGTDRRRVHLGTDITCLHCTYAL